MARAKNAKFLALQYLHKTSYIKRTNLLSYYVDLLNQHGRVMFVFVSPELTYVAPHSQQMRV